LTSPLLQVAFWIGAFTGWRFKHHSHNALALQFRPRHFPQIGGLLAGGMLMVFLSGWFLIHRWSKFARINPGYDDDYWDDGVLRRNCRHWPLGRGLSFQRMPGA
jgi:hypothetical protein